VCIFNFLLEQPIHRFHTALHTKCPRIYLLCLQCMYEICGYLIVIHFCTSVHTVAATQSVRKLVFDSWCAIESLYRRWHKSKVLIERTWPSRLLQPRLWPILLIGEYWLI